MPARLSKIHFQLLIECRMSIFLFFCIGIATLFAALLLLAASFFYGVLWLGPRVCCAMRGFVWLTMSQSKGHVAVPTENDHDDTEVIIVPEQPQRQAKAKPAPKPEPAPVSAPAPVQVLPFCHSDS
jgi:hypothetical protein